MMTPAENPPFCRCPARECGNSQIGRDEWVGGVGDIFGFAPCAMLAAGAENAPKPQCQKTPAKPKNSPLGNAMKEGD